MVQGLITKLNLNAQAQENTLLAAKLLSHGSSLNKWMTFLLDYRKTY